MTENHGEDVAKPNAAPDVSTEMGEGFSPYEELVALADEWIAAATDEQEKRGLSITKTELLAAMDGVKSK